MIRADYLFAFLVTLLIFGISSTASSHGDPPEGTQIYSVDGGWVYVTNFGAMSAERPDEYVCEEAFFASESFHVAPLKVNRWVTFSRSTVAVTDDGCHFEQTFDLPTRATDVAVRPSTEEVAFVTRDSGQTDLWYSDDGGLQWNHVGVELSDINPSGIGFIGSEEIVVVGYQTDEETRGTAALMTIDPVSETGSDLVTDDALVYPELLDSSDDTFLWHARREGETEVYWSRSDDIEFGHFPSPNWPTSGALSRDGARAYLGGIDGEGRGVFKAGEDEPSAWEEIVAGHRALCMTEDGDDLLVCGHRRDDDHDLARYNRDDGLQPINDFRDLQGYRSDCPDDSRVMQTCPPVWPELAPYFGIDVEEDHDHGDHDHDHDDHDHDDHDHDHDHDDHDDHDHDHDHDGDQEGDVSDDEDSDDESRCTSVGGVFPGSGWLMFFAFVALLKIRMRLDRRTQGPPNFVG